MAHLGSIDGDEEVEEDVGRVVYSMKMYPLSSLDCFVYYLLTLLQLYRTRLTNVQAHHFLLRKGVYCIVSLYCIVYSVTIL